jgi:hypothetical protein
MTSLSERYFRPKAVEFDGKLYEWLGVVRFKRLLMRFASAAECTTTFYFLGAVVFAANFHCFLLQRYNRIRVYRVLNRGADGSDKIREGTVRGY